MDIKNKYEALLASMDQGFAVIEVLFDENDTPVDFCFLETNTRFETLTGLKGVVGKTAFEVFPDMQTDWFDIYARVIGSGEPARFTRSSSTPGWMYEVNASRIGGKESRKLAVLFSSVAELKEMEAEREKLRKTIGVERANLAEAFQEAPAAIATLRGPKHVYEMTNPVYSGLMGHRELIGKSVKESAPDLASQGFVELLDQVYQSGEAYAELDRRVLLQSQEGEEPKEHYFAFSFIPLREADGSVSGILSHNVDVTERKHAHLALAERTADLKIVNAELESFNYSVSHDLRAPLRAIDGFSQALFEDYGELLDETGRGYLKRIRSAAERMNGLIDDLLKLSRFSNALLKQQQVNLSGLAQEIITNLQAEEPERKVAVHVQENITVPGDEGLLNIALENLIGNAWKFTNKHPDAEIKLGTSSTNGKTSCFVKDNGAGFNQNYADKLFTPFQRLHSPEEFTGQGIGLTIVQRIIHRHGGRIWAESNEGKGATFHFTLPTETRHFPL